MGWGGVGWGKKTFKYTCTQTWCYARTCARVSCYAEDVLRHQDSCLCCKRWPALENMQNVASNVGLCKRAVGKLKRRSHIDSSKQQKNKEIKEAHTINLTMKMQLGSPSYKTLQISIEQLRVSSWLVKPNKFSDFFKSKWIWYTFLKSRAGGNQQFDNIEAPMKRTCCISTPTDEQKLSDEH